MYNGKKEIWERKSNVNASFEVEDRHQNYQQYYGRSIILILILCLFTRLVELWISGKNDPDKGNLAQGPLNQGSPVLMTHR